MDTRIVTDVATGRRFRMPTHNEVKQDMHNLTFSEAVDDLNSLVKSKRPSSGQSVAEMSRAKDYNDESLDDFDRAPQGQRRRDMRDAWAGIQSFDDDLERDAEEIDLTYQMLVSGRPSRIRFPGARGDSTLHAIDEDGYLVNDEEDPDDTREGRGRLRRRNAELRSTLGGDAQSWRAQASRRGVGEDEYATGKSFGLRGRGFTPADLLKSFNTIKSRLQDAMSDEKIDPEVLMNYEGALTEPRLGLDVNAAMRALALVPPGVRKAYGIPTISNNGWEELGRIRRAA